MNFKPVERINLADSLCGLQNKTEALSRAVIHQSYYGVFNQLSNEIDNRLFYKVDELIKSSSVHKAYIDAFKNELSRQSDRNSLKYKSLDQIIRLINRSRANRRKADYDLDFTLGMATAQLSVTESKKIFSLLENLE